MMRKPTIGVRRSASPRTVQARPEAGAILVLAATVMTTLMIMAAFAIDVGFWYNTANEAQRAADIAALSGVEELARVESATGDRATAEAAAEALIRQLVAENGFDPAAAVITITTNAYGADEVSVDVLEADLDLFFAGIVLDQVDISREAVSAMNDCAATCGQLIPVNSPLNGMVDAGTGGDGWRPTLTDDNLVFNLFHHGDGQVLQCVDKTTNPADVCVVGGNSSFYPVEPYPNIETNYTPKLAAIGSKVYFVVQENNTVGLGCWDGTTHARCAGFLNPILLESYDSNGGNYGTRIDGPEVVGNRLFMFGDNGVMYCVDGAGNTCAGYPKQTRLRIEGHEMTINGASYADGVDIDEMQFDMEPTIAGDKIFVVLTPAPTDAWLTCWDTTTNNTCAGFTSASTSAGRAFLFLSYNTSNQLTGVCARGGHKAGGTGHECFNLSGTSVGPKLPFDFSGGGNRVTQQSATGETTFGNMRVFFPYRGSSEAECWDWTIAAECAISGSNWSSTSSTEDYAYIYDGTRCMYGLGHSGQLWTFDIDTGQFPCPADGTAKTTIEPCACADGVTKRWTSLILTDATDLSHFNTFEVVITNPSTGAVFATVDLTTERFVEIDLRPLNSLSPVPPEMVVVINAEVRPGHGDLAFAGGDIGLVQISGVLPTLIE